ncbi:MAG: hypothetical protein RJA09_414 [Pseudomonadota bacterium]
MFNLPRYFLLTSATLFVAAAVALGWVYHRFTVAQIVQMAEQHNEAMTHVFENTLWPRHGPFLLSMGGDSILQHRRSPQLAALDADVQRLMAGTQVVKVKVYNRQGITLYSSDLRQVGADQGGNPGFLGALNNTPVSDLTHRDHFDAFDRVIADLDVISSYIPIHNPDNAVLGVLEVYQDVTPALKALDQRLYQAAWGVLAVLVFLLGLQWLVVRRAHHIIQGQERTLADTNRELDARVLERTHALEVVNQQLSDQITQREAAESRLRHLAHQDPLTRLPNRLALIDLLTDGLAAAAAAGQQVAVIYIDLDHFENVNTSLGHQVGNDLLKAVAQRLANRLTLHDNLSRVGADEFVCFRRGIPSLEGALALAQQLCETLSTPFVVGPTELLITATVGVSVYPQDGDAADLLVRHADTAMYRAKRQGRNTICHYTPDMTALALARLNMHRSLRDALVYNEMSLVYQPQVHTPDGHITGAEALVRWNSRALGPVPPAQFIPLAEDTGFILALGLWVLREACQQVVAWEREGLVLPRLSVNLSPKQIERPGLVEQVQQVLSETGLPPQRLELEITESALMAGGPGLRTLEALRGLGIKLSVDDFGTGYSSLAYLKNLPLDKLKIDRAFVVGIGQGQGDEAIIQAIVALADHLGLERVAEGVETADQARFLATAGCPHVQGFGYGRPVPAAEFGSAHHAALNGPAGDRGPAPS